MTERTCGTCRFLDVPNSPECYPCAESSTMPEWQPKDTPIPLDIIAIHPRALTDAERADAAERERDELQARLERIVVLSHGGRTKDSAARAISLDNIHAVAKGDA